MRRLPLTVVVCCKFFDSHYLWEKMGDDYKFCILSYLIFYHVIFFHKLRMRVRFCSDPNASLTVAGCLKTLNCDTFAWGETLSTLLNTVYNRFITVWDCLLIRQMFFMNTSFEMPRCIRVNKKNKNKRQATKARNQGKITKFSTNQDETRNRSSKDSEEKSKTGPGTNRQQMREHTWMNDEFSQHQRSEFPSWNFQLPTAPSVPGARCQKLQTKNMADRNKIMSHTRNWTLRSAACVLNKTEEEKHYDIVHRCKYSISSAWYKYCHQSDNWLPMKSG